jgi:hypothetical protein
MLAVRLPRASWPSILMATRRHAGSKTLRVDHGDAAPRPHIGISLLDPSDFADGDRGIEPAQRAVVVAMKWCNVSLAR